MGASVYRISPGRNSGVRCHALLQGIFPSQGSNLCLLPCRQILCRLNHQGSPGNMEKLAVMPLNTDPVACLSDFSGGAWRSPRKGYFKRRCHSEPSWAQVCIRHETPQARLLPGSPPDPRKRSWRRSETKVGRPDTKTYKDNLVNLTWPRGRVSKEPIPRRGSQMTRGLAREPRRTFQGWPT